MCCNLVEFNVFGSTVWVQSISVMGVSGCKWNIMTEALDQLREGSASIAQLSILQDFMMESRSLNASRI